MHPTHDPHDPQYLDEATVRDELTRVFDTCHGCRRCVDLCPVFPTLFELIDRTGDRHAADRHAGDLTPSDQDDVVDGCFHCNRCSADCPYTPERHPAAIDVPRLVLRARAMRAGTGQMGILHRLTAGAAAQADALRLLGDAPGTRTAGQPRRGWRAAKARVSAWSPIRLTLPSVGQRFSAWLASHTPVFGPVRRGSVVLVPTCLVEYQQPEVAIDLVRVYERLGIECSVSRVGCCGAPWLHTGDSDRFAKIARENVRLLAAHLRSGSTEAVVVAEATCRSVIRREYVAAVGDDARADAVLVTSRLTDPASHLLDVHGREGNSLFADLVAAESMRVVVHRSCHDRADTSADSTVELFGLIGVEVQVVDGCAAVGGRWNAAAAAAPRSSLLGQLVTGVDKAGVETADIDIVAAAPAPSTPVVVGGCGFANTMVSADTAVEAVHPMTLVARRFGIDDPATTRSVTSE